MIYKVRGILVTYCNNVLRANLLNLNFFPSNVFGSRAINTTITALFHRVDQPCNRHSRLNREILIANVKRLTSRNPITAEENVATCRFHYGVI